MKSGIIYTGRLGDIVGTLPLAKILNDSGHEVIHYCCSDFADIFNAVTYVKPRLCPGDPAVAYAFAQEVAPKECAVIYDRQIFPRLWHDYRHTGKTWQQYYYDNMPELIEATPHFDVDDGKKYFAPGTLLVAMHGVSSPMAVNWQWVRAVIDVAKSTGEIKEAVYFCGRGQTNPIGIRNCDDVSPGHMPTAMKQARMILARNSAPAWIARGTGVPTLHIPDSSFPLQDTAGLAHNMVRVEHGNFDCIGPAVTKALRGTSNG
jgi:hypothetical protein